MMIELPEVDQPNSETISCRESSHGFNREVITVSEPLESREQQVMYIGFNHMLDFSLGIFTVVAPLTFKILKGEQAIGGSEGWNGRNRAGQMLSVLSSDNASHHIRTGSY